MKYFVMLVVVFFLSCNNKETRESNNTEPQKDLELTPTFKNLHLNSKVENTIKSFLSEDTCKGCLHEIYVDKVRPNSAIITVKSRPYSVEYLRTENPLFYTKIAGATFSVFTGLEDIIVGDKANSLPVGDSVSNNFKIWSIYLETDSIRVEKNIGMPFFPPGQIIHRAYMLQWTMIQF